MQLPPLERFSKEEKNALAMTLFREAHFTTNQWIRVLEWLSDLKKIKKTGLKEILDDDTLQQVMSHPRLDPRTRGKKLFERIRTLRFPNVSKVLKESREETFL